MDCSATYIHTQWFKIFLCSFLKFRIKTNSRSRCTCLNCYYMYSKNIIMKLCYGIILDMDYAHILKRCLWIDMSDNVIDEIITFVVVTYSHCGEKTTNARLLRYISSDAQIAHNGKFYMKNRFSCLFRIFRVRIELP